MIKEILLQNTDWDIYSDKYPLVKDVTHIFKISTSSYYNSIRFNYNQVLSEAELKKANRYLKNKDKERFIVSKYSLRSILSKFVSINPASIQFHQYGNKKPAINGIDFNVTHSENLILIAIGPSEIGIDIEFVNHDFNFETLIHTCFSYEEQSHINSSNSFYKFWTRKEALLKATGEGITEQMQEISCINANIQRNEKSYHIKSFSIEEHQYVFSIVTATVGSQQLFLWNYF